MTFQYASDLHLEFPENRRWLAEHPIEPKAEVLLLAGDIVPFSELRRHKDFFRYLGDAFRQVLWIPGNHEYYGGGIAQRSGMLDEAIAPNVRLVNDTAVQVGGARILCTTLWSYISQLNEAAMRRNVSDYQAIRHNNRLLQPAHTTRLHETSLAWLKGELAKPHPGPTVVMTHHVPTLMHYPPQYKGSPLNEAFAVELSGLIGGCGAEAWIYGHHHHNTATFTIGNTRMLINQLGYVQMGEHRSFDPGAVFASDPAD
jgi:predicted phosphohydrolase